MKLSSSISYAIGILLQVHVKGQEGPTTAATIATGCKFPPRFLYRILRRLVDAGRRRARYPGNARTRVRWLAHVG